MQAVDHGLQGLSFGHRHTSPSLNHMPAASLLVLCRLQSTSSPAPSSIAIASCRYQPPPTWIPVRPAASNAHSLNKSSSSRVESGAPSSRESGAPITPSWSDSSSCGVSGGESGAPSCAASAGVVPIDSVVVMSLPLEVVPSGCTIGSAGGTVAPWLWDRAAVVHPTGASSATIGSDAGTSDAVLAVLVAVLVALAGGCPILSSLRFVPEERTGSCCSLISPLLGDESIQGSVLGAVGDGATSRWENSSSGIIGASTPAKGRFGGGATTS